MRSFRFLFRAFSPNYKFVVVICAGLTLGSVLTGAAYGREGVLADLVSGYYVMFPAILQLANLLAGMGYSTSCLNIALSMGATRKGYFRGVCALQMVNAILFWLAHVVLALLPGWLGWREDFLISPISTAFAPSTPLMLLAFGWLGCALGGLYLKHRALSGIIIGLLVFFSLINAPFAIFGWVNWGDLELVICVVCLIAVPLFALWSRRGFGKGVVLV